MHSVAEVIEDCNRLPFDLEQSIIADWQRHCLRVLWGGGVGLLNPLDLGSPEKTFKTTQLVAKPRLCQSFLPRRRSQAGVLVAQCAGSSDGLRFLCMGLSRWLRGEMIWKGVARFQTLVVEDAKEYLRR